MPRYDATNGVMNERRALDHEFVKAKRHPGEVNVSANDANQTREVEFGRKRKVECVSLRGNWSLTFPFPFGDQA